MSRPKVARIVKGLLILSLLAFQAACVVQDQGLIYASGFGQLGIVKLLLVNGADVNARNKDGNTPLIVASLMGHTDIVKLLLDKGADINAMNRNSMTPLMWASSEGRIDVVRVLVGQGADVNVKGMMPALSLACEEGRLEVVKLLVDKGADVNAKDHWGNTALMLASKKRYTQIAELLKSSRS